MEKIVSFQLQRASPDHSHAKTFKNIAAQSHSLNFSRTLLANLTDSQTVCKIYMLARVYFLLGTEIVAKSSAGHKGGARGRRGGPPPSSVLSPACALQPLTATTGGVSCNRNTRLTGDRSLDSS